MSQSRSTGRTLGWPVYLALALLVNTDYARADVPMMPVAKGEAVTRQQILMYAILLLLISLLPVLFGFLGPIYMLAALVLGGGLIRTALLLIRDKTGAAARTAYKFSTAYLAFLFMAMILDRLILKFLL